MRNVIYKAEIEILFFNHQVENEQANFICKTLFSNERSSQTAHFYCKSLDSSWETELSLQIKDLPLLSKIKRLFESDSDLSLPSNLRHNILDNKNQMAIFVGAGVSKLLGYPRWGELGDKAIDHLQNNKRITHFEKDKIKVEISDPKQKLSILQKLATPDESRVFYESYFKESKQDIIHNPFDLISQLSKNWLKLTSNIDYSFRNSYYKLIEKPPTKINSRRNSLETESPILDLNSITVSSGFNWDLIATNKIYYIHGEIDKPDDLIFTTKDYIENYYQDSPLKKFLNQLFTNYSVLFVGYGLEELQILDSVISINKIMQNQNNHFALMPTYESEIGLFNIKQKYFKTLNIETIPYYLDVDHYGRLIKVLDRWVKEIDAEANQKKTEDIEFINRVLGVK